MLDLRTHPFHRSDHVDKELSVVGHRLEGSVYDLA
ncbi:hypothetical protein Pla52n_17470 [Stieleria varia]|uniref:Uncharacterized protein n=1 Tax=Stieleria varia TaxID=2528005 RepID=A0A5C6B3Y5_9BACT|nr:hypothetical protein Pla52n_17470 [Stieleria varia]